MLEYMLDTNICIHVIRNYPGNLHQLFAQRAERLCISSITLCELHYGAHKSSRTAANLEEVDLFASRLEVLAFSGSAASAYGRIRTLLDRAGKRIGANDLLIAAHALKEGLTLVTNNRREFDRVPGLRVENWIDPAT